MTPIQISISFFELGMDEIKAPIRHNLKYGSLSFNINKVSSYFAILYQNIIPLVFQ